MPRTSRATSPPASPTGASPTGASPTGPQLWRLARLNAWLGEGRRFTASDAAQELGVTTRTVGADLEWLRRLGTDVAYDARAGTYVLGEDRAPLPLPMFGREDLAALLVAHHALDALGDAPDAALLRGVAERLAAHLPETVRVASDALARTVRYRSGPGTERPAATLVLEDAARGRRVVRIAYHAASTDAPTERAVEPRAVVHRDGRWYLVAWCRLRQDMRDFRLDRIHAADVLDETFEDDGFDLDAYLAGSFGMVRGEPAVRVRLRFSARQARWIREERWHPSQTLTPGPEGTLDLEMEAAGLADLARWVLSYGDEVEVLAPAALRERIAAEASAMAARYGAPSPDAAL